MEIIVVMSIMTYITIIASDFVVKGLISNTFNSEQITAVESARRAANVIVQEMRTGMNSASNTPTFALALPQEVKFFADANDDQLPDQIRYFVSGKELLRGVVIASTTIPYYKAAETTSMIVDYVNNQSEPIFTYFSTTTAAMTAPNSAVGNIKRVNINLKINVNPMRAPQDYYVTSDVMVRNLKDY